MVKVWGGLEFVRVPAGEFVMGSLEGDALAWSDERPQHVLEIGYDYWIGRYPVTNAQFGTFVDSTSHLTRAEQEGWAWVWDVGQERWVKTEGADWRHPLGPEDDITGRADHPVVTVSLYDARAFCAWLDGALGAGRPGGVACRLPSEAEWEKAARGPGGRVWPWGDAFDTGLCNSREGGPVGTVPVGGRSPGGDSVYGAGDMAGNIWEWTETLWGENRDRPEFVYPYDGGDGREDVEAGPEHYRIVRGGCFKDDRQGVRAACRDLDPPGYSLNNLGLRVLLA